MHLMLQISTVSFSDLVYLCADHYVTVTDTYAHRSDLLMQEVYPAQGLKGECFCNWVNCTSPISLGLVPEYMLGTAAVLAKFTGV